MISSTFCQLGVSVGGVRTHPAHSTTSSSCEINRLAPENGSCDVRLPRNLTHFPVEQFPTDAKIGCATLLVTPMRIRESILAKQV
jgi:hypothetical protein